MFCKGKCDKCNLLYEIRMHNILLKKDEVVKKCAFLHMADSYIRIEERLIGIQASIESSRNEKVSGDEKIAQTIANGFLGVMQSVDNKKQIE